MKEIKEIRLENFRCYTDQTIRFKPGINLLIGDNASGKTSVLVACKYVLSAFFSGFSDENTKWVSPEASDFNIQMSVDGIILPEKPINISFTCDVDIYDTLRFGHTFCNLADNLYILQKKTKKNSRALVSGIVGYRDYALLLQQTHFEESTNRQVYSLPLFAHFSTEDIHASRKLAADKFKKYAQKSSFGYYECLDGNGFYDYWVKRLLSLQEGQKNLQEIEIVRSAIINALGSQGCNIIHDMEVRPYKKTVYYILTDGREVEASHLSDGYRRLVNIVTDLAFRCALLNRGLYGLESAQRTKGIALIDEVDLHLHPTLQAKVLKGLRKAFPKIQFIATTHAPMVMSGVESNEQNVVYKLSYTEQEGYTVQETQTYGLDVSTITESVLHQTPREQETNNKLLRLFDFIDNERIEEARTLLDELRSSFGDNLPELAQAEAMLNFSIEDDAENQ